MKLFQATLGIPGGYSQPSPTFPVFFFSCLKGHGILQLTAEFWLYRHAAIRMIDVKFIFFYLKIMMWCLIHAEFSPSLLTEPKEALDRGHIKIKKPTIDSSPCPSAVDS